MKKKYKLLIALAAYTVILCVIGIISVTSVNGLLDEYEASQPEQQLENTIEEIVSAARQGKTALLSKLDLDESELSGGSDLIDRQMTSFSELLATSELSFAVKSSTLEHLTYAVLSGDEPLLYIDFKNVSTVTKLVIFSTTDWELESVVPVLKSREIILPSYISLYYDGAREEGVADEGSVSYKINYLTSEGDYVLSDAFGNSVPYQSDALPSVEQWSITVPSNFTVIVGNAAVGDSYIVSREENAAYQYVNAYADFPSLVTYSFYTLSSDVVPTITDNLGNKVDAAFEDNTLRITAQATASELSGSFMSSYEILEAAHTWSLFMTDDLSGAYHGFYTVAEYLISDSYLYGVAYAWATGIDITFTSPHILGSVPFLNEAVGDYVIYSDNCFSCNVKFDKHMILDSWQVVMDKMNSTFYFVKGADGIWRIGDILEIVE